MRPSESPSESLLRSSERLLGLTFSYIISAGGLALLTAYLASTPEIKRIKDVSGDVGTKVTNVMVDNTKKGNPVVTSRRLSDWRVRAFLRNLPTSLDIPTALENARSGEFDGVKFIIETYDRRLDELLNPPGGGGDYEFPDDRDEEAKREEGEARHRQMIEELGISEREYQLFRNVTDLRAHMDMLDDIDGEFSRAVEDTPGTVFLGGDQANAITHHQLTEILQLLGVIAYESGDPYDQMTLSLVGMDAQELKDFAKGIYFSFRGDERDESIAANREYLRATYGFGD